MFAEPLKSSLFVLYLVNHQLLVIHLWHLKRIILNNWNTSLLQNRAIHIFQIYVWDNQFAKIQTFALLIRCKFTMLMCWDILYQMHFVVFRELTLLNKLPRALSELPPYKKFFVNGWLFFYKAVTAIDTHFLRWGWWWWWWFWWLLSLLMMVMVIIYKAVTAIGSNLPTFF